MHAVKLHSDHVLKLEIIVSFYTMMTALICPRPDQLYFLVLHLHSYRQETTDFCLYSCIVSCQMQTQWVSTKQSGHLCKPSCRGNHVQIELGLPDQQTVGTIVSWNRTPRSTSPVRPICSSASLA